MEEEPVWCNACGEEQVEPGEQFCRSCIKKDMEQEVDWEREMCKKYPVNEE